MLLIAGCTSHTKHKWLTFFFDGVPGSDGASVPAQPGSPPAETTNLPPVQVPSAAEPLVVVHPPYADRKCIACHASNYSQRLKDEVSTICIGCHKAFLVKAKFSHAPMEDGQCTLCHAPHQAKEKFLLVKDSRELCFDCHEPEEVLKIKACGQAEARTCTVCHDPHQENRRFLLRARAEKPVPAPNKTPDK